MTRFIRRHRRALAFLLAFLGVLVALSSVRERPATWDAVVVAADLPAGHVLAADDLRSVPLAEQVRPTTAITDASTAVGRVLAGPMAAEELLLDSRLVGPNLLDGSPPGHVALAVSLADPAQVAFLRPGDLVDIIAAGGGSALDDEPGATAATTVATNVRVLAIPGAAGAAASGLLGSGTAGSSGAAIVVGVPSRTAATITGAAADSALSVVMRGDS